MSDQFMDSLELNLKKYDENSSSQFSTFSYAPPPRGPPPVVASSAYPQQMAAPNQMQPQQYSQPPQNYPVPNPLSQVTITMVPNNPIPQMATLPQQHYGVVPHGQHGNPPYGTSAPPRFIPPVMASMNPAMMQPVPFVPMASAAFNDPNNDFSSWSEHTAADGRQYYYNKITKKSTYDKPECLKSAEERSIPPCPWKEYSADGKKYYSDGKESK